VVTSPITDRNECVPLEGDGAKRGTQEKICNPNPRTDNSALPMGFEVAIRNTLGVSVKPIDHKAYRKS